MIANTDLEHAEIEIAKRTLDRFTPQPFDIMQVVYRNWNGNIIAASLTEDQHIEGRAICSREPDYVTGGWGKWRDES
jgi:hypothetical protein